MAAGPEANEVTEVTDANLQFEAETDEDHDPVPILIVAEVLQAEADPDPTATIGKPKGVLHQKTREGQKKMAMKIKLAHLRRTVSQTVILV